MKTTNLNLTAKEVEDLEMDLFIEQKFTERFPKFRTKQPRRHSYKEESAKTSKFIVAGIIAGVSTLVTLTACFGQTL